MGSVSKNKRLQVEPGKLGAEVSKGTKTKSQRKTLNCLQNVHRVIIHCDAQTGSMVVM